MTPVLIYIISVVVGFATAMVIYVTTNRGLPDRSIHQQTTRFFFAAILAMLPMAVSGIKYYNQLLYYQE